MKKYIFLFILALFGLFAIFVSQYASFHDGKLHVIFCNVGQGDGIVIRTPGGSVMVNDSGPDDSILTCLTHHLPFWERTIAIAQLTHPHADHLNGFLPLLSRFTIENFLTEKLANKTIGYQQLQQGLSAQHIPIVFAISGKSFSIGKVTFQYVGPTQKFLDATSPNGIIGESKEFASLETLVRYGNFSVLLDGDSQVDELHDALMNTSISFVTVLQVPHHGSRTGLSWDILQNLKPRLAVISVGLHNRYGHPHTQTLQLLEQSKTKILRTDQNGDVEIISDGSSWQVK